MKLAIACVLKSGGDFNHEWVYKLRRGLMRGGLGSLPFFTFTDCPDIIGNAIKLETNLPGWWSKMELFRLNIPYDWLYFDLDMVVTGDISCLVDIAKRSPNAIMLRDMFYPQYLASGMMYIPHSCKISVWPGFLAKRKEWMKEKRGDQEAIAQLLPRATGIWQDQVPGLIKSYKADDCRRKGPQGASIVMFHGKPRPNEVKHNWMTW